MLFAVTLNLKIRNYGGDWNTDYANQMVCEDRIIYGAKT